jgi:hypothetical protein
MAPDTDFDGVPDFQDQDDDGDGIPTKAEDTNGNGNPLDDDHDGDGIPDYQELQSGGYSGGALCTVGPLAGDSLLNAGLVLLTLAWSARRRRKTV